MTHIPVLPVAVLDAKVLFPFRIRGLARVAGHHREQGALAAFQGCFGNKKTLARRFGQLADLRNGIRHCRSAEEIALREGETAILWIEHLSKSRSKLAQATDSALVVPNAPNPEDGLKSL